jgi:hypothetical protein
MDWLVGQASRSCCHALLPSGEVSRIIVSVSSLRNFFQKCSVLNRRRDSSLEYIPQMERTVTLFDAYAAQRGLFARLARRLGLDPSYISRVANGERRSKRISRAIEAELNKMYSVSWKIAKSSKRGSRLAASGKSRASRPRV